ncbi:MAG: hypothetical protein RLZZ450_3034 [Pseudomonadota bacterium]|jgi:hypothetical protein
MIDLPLVNRPFPSQREPAPRWLLSVAVALSLLLHAAAAFVSLVVLRPPELDIEFELPMDVELGTAEAIGVAEVPPPVPSEPSEGQKPATSGLGAGDAGLLDAGPLHDAGSADAAVRDAAVADAAESKPRQRDAGDLVAGVADAGAAMRVPPGAQIALRVDMARIRKSPVAAEVRSLLSAIPDWKALLDGSGIDPIEQVDRLLIATPNLQRDKIVLAGRYLGGEQVVRDAVQRLATSKGVAAEWRRQGNVQVAPWANADQTERVIALVGPAHFTISRAEDLPRVLAIAAARAERSKKGARQPPQQHPADALLSMEDDEGMSLEVEGAAQFVRRGRRGIPERLRLSAIERAGERLDVLGTFTYVDAATAEDARDYWLGLRDRYASNTLVALLGLSAPLQSATVERSDSELRIKLTLSADQVRLILGYVRELLAPPARP